jgi:hypothetical protein
MVRNNKGGKNGKKMARKHIKTETEEENKIVRIPMEEGEIFACSTKLLGNAMVSVVDLSGNEYICIIRKKFKGRGKRENTIQKGTWLLVGKRLYEKETSNGKKPKCDVLEVYNDKEKHILKKRFTEYKWDLFESYNDDVTETAENEESIIEFDESQPDYAEMLENMSDYFSDSSTSSN